MTNNSMPPEGPRIPEKSVYLEQFNNLLKVLAMCDGFSKNDSTYEYIILDQDNIIFTFSDLVTKKIILPAWKKTLEEVVYTEKRCHIKKTLEKVSVVDNNRIVVRGASDPIHALYVCIALYVNEHLPLKMRADGESLPGE